MPADPQEEARVRPVLVAYGVRSDLGTFDFGPPPAGAAGAYFPQRDTFALPVGAHDQTIIHEGAHAEHYHGAGIVGPAFPQDRATAIGALILSEAFVGFRLTNANGFVPFERAALPNHAATAIEVAEAFILVPGARGPHFVQGNVTTTMLFMFLQRMLPLVVAETVAGQPIFTAGLSATSIHPQVMGTGTVLLFAVQEVMRLVGQGPCPAALTSVANMRALGTAFLARATAVGLV